MCSISGWCSSYDLPAQVAEDLATALLFYGRSRGEQSAGAFVNGRTHKRAVDPCALPSDPAFSQLFNGANRMALLHTRQPTSGGTGNAQAQPFRMDDTVTVHNGYYFDVKDLKKTHGINKPSGVDSNLVTSFIHRYGPMKLPRFIRTTDGPSAIGAIHDGRMFLFRSGNPLVYMTIRFADNDKITLFASTKEMLLNAVRYVYLLTYPITYDLKEGFLFGLSPDGIKQLTTKKAEYQDSWCGYSGYSFGSGVHGSRQVHGWEKWLEGHKEKTKTTLEDLKDLYPANAEDIDTLAAEGLDAEAVEDWLIRWGTLDYTPLTTTEEEEE